MKILLIFPDINSFHSIRWHPGLAYLAGYLITHEHEVEIEYINSKDNYNVLINHVKNFLPDIVGFTVVETQFIYVKEIAKIIRKNHRCLIICGGAYVTLFPDCIKNEKNIDGIIRGEGELALLDLINRLENNRDIRKTQNYCYFDEEKKIIIKNSLAPLIENLDELPFPERKKFNYQKDIDSHKSIEFHFLRGCPFKCTYCCNHAFAKIYGMEKNTIRFRSVSSCIDEIKDVIKQHHISSDTTLLFNDDLFTLNRKWLKEFLNLYKTEIGIPFMCCTRCNLASKELFIELKEGCCFRVMMSIESGNEFIRNKIMKRGISQEQIYNSFKWAHEAGIETNGVCIIGLPFETKEMIWDTIKTQAKTNTTSPGVNIFYPYSGTELRNLCEEYGFLPNELGEVIERRESILNLPTITKKEIDYFYKNWEKLVLAKKSFYTLVRYYYLKSLPLKTLEKISNRSLLLKRIFRTLNNYKKRIYEK